MVYFLVALFLFVLYVLSPLKRPWPTESDLSFRLWGYFHFYYTTKYIKQVRRPVRGASSEQMFAETTAPTNRKQLTDSKQFTISAVGDMMTRKDLVAPRSPNLWSGIEKELFDADLTMGNMEFAVSTNEQHYHIIRFAIDPKIAEPLLPETKYGRFDYVALANNHINDAGKEGICETLNYLKGKNILNSGASCTKEDQDQFPIVDINGVKVALLSYTFSTNGLPLDKDAEFGTNVIRFNALKDEDYDNSLILKHIKLAKERGAELIVSNHHWGIEFEYYPSERLIKRAHELMEAGLDVIVGHHPHILNLNQWHKTSDGRDTLILYSLGNITGQAVERSTMRMANIARINIESGLDNSGKKVVRVADVDMIPTFFSVKNRWGDRADHRILPLFKTEADILAGKEVPHNGIISKFEIKRVAKEFRKYLIQPKAFNYR
jgi:poly-gamma-glutamate synthesis protein (capsule biosynthesis protein)